MRFYCIYTIDCPEDVKMDPYLRIIQKHGSEFWTETESDDLSSEYGYLGDQWEHGSHKKFGGWLNKDQFIEFVRASSLRPESCETGGMLTPDGHFPAIAFNLIPDPIGEIPMNCASQGKVLRKIGTGSKA